METTALLILGALGIPAILFGANMVVKHGLILARKFEISQFFVGLTVFSIGTSVPELFTHILSAFKILAQPELIGPLSSVAIGTNLGSNIIQITAIVGLVGLWGTIKTDRVFMLRDYLFMLLGILGLWYFAWTDALIERWEGWVLMLAYGAYLVYLSFVEELDDKIEDHPHVHPLKSFLMIVLGFVIVLISAEFILDAAVFVSQYLGISGSLIGAVVIGVATAMPELTTAVVGLKKKAGGIAVGTLVGSNITNPLLGIGLGAAISTYTVDAAILQIDLPFWFGISVLGWFFFYTGHKVDKWQAALLLGSYAIYLVWRIYGVADVLIDRVL